MQLVKINCTAVPTALEKPIREVAARTGEWPISVFRGREAEPLINPCGSHSQHQIVNATPAQRRQWGVLGTPNPEKQSTHECFNDGVVYGRIRGRKIEDWQCGMDYANAAIQKVMAAFRAIGERPFHPYDSGNEYHHLNLLKKPKIVNPFLPLKFGSARNQGLWVYVLTGRLKNCGYLKNRTSKYTRTVETVVKVFQTKHHMTVDGVVGDHTWTSLKAAERWCKQHGRKEYNNPL